MDQLARFLFFNILIFPLVNSDTFTVKVGTDEYVNEIDSKFLSFTVDPKFLFASSEKYNSKECICMASSLTPAYIRIAGPSTSHMKFHNTTIAITDLDPTELESTNNDEAEKKPRAKDLLRKRDTIASKRRTIFKSSDLEKRIQEDIPKKLRLNYLLRKRETSSELKVTHNQWKKFVKWAKSTGFDLVFALNSNEKTSAGIWDPNTALNILTVAEKENIENMFWQLGYECKNQSIEEYLNDMETLRVIVETFQGAKGWRVVGGDVTNCLQADSKSDFKDYVTLSNDMMDAVLLNGNSSSQELLRLSDTERFKLLKLLSSSVTPLWLTESLKQLENLDEMERAADWITSLGYSARNGFSVNFRQLYEVELYEPSLSFYMALLFKNLVGERVLDVDMDAPNAAIFAHCTSLRHKRVPGAVTLYGVNMDEEPARFSLKLSKKEEGGDIMQFILGHDTSGNIVVNGRAMYYEGDIRPVVKRVRPYKTLLINLPPKSFGFWVLANTRVEACRNVDDATNSTSHEFLEAQPIKIKGEKIKLEKDANTSNEVRKKRSIVDNLYRNYPDHVDLNEEYNYLYSDEVKDQAIRSKLHELHKIFQLNKQNNRTNKLYRSKRQTDVGDRVRNFRLKPRTNVIKRMIERQNGNESKKVSLIHKLSALSSKLNNTILAKRFGNFLPISRFGTKKGINRHFKKSVKDSQRQKNIKQNVRTRRSIADENKKLGIHSEELTDKRTNSLLIELGSNEDVKLGKILRKIYEQIHDLSVEVQDMDKMDKKSSVNIEDYDYKIEDLKPKLKYSSPILSTLDEVQPNKGIIKATLGKLLSVVGELNHNLNRIWRAVSLVD